MASGYEVRVMNLADRGLRKSHFVFVGGCWGCVTKLGRRIRRRWTCSAIPGTVMRILVSRLIQTFLQCHLLIFVMLKLVSAYEILI
jgi:hypothetical protein